VITRLRAGKLVIRKREREKYDETRGKKFKISSECFRKPRSGEKERKNLVRGGQS